MNRIDAVLRRVADDLNRRRLPWALVGGFGVSARAEPRFTRDVDVVVAVDDDANAEGVVQWMMSLGYRLIASVEQDAMSRLATVRLAGASSDVVVDVLFASSGIEAEIADAAEDIELLPGLVLPVATTGHLIAVKLLARDDERRPQDRSDLRSLRQAASPVDLAVARDAVVLIEERGYARDRDLQAALADLVGRGST